MADNPHYVTATITAQNTGTDWLEPGKAARFDIIVSGQADSTFHLQAKRPGEADSAARDIGDPITLDIVEQGGLAGEWLYRLFCKTGNYGTDSAVLELNS